METTVTVSDMSVFVVGVGETEGVGEVEGIGVIEVEGVEVEGVEATLLEIGKDDDDEVDVGVIVESSIDIEEEVGDEDGSNDVILRIRG